MEPKNIQEQCQKAEVKNSWRWPTYILSSEGGIAAAYSINILREKICINVSFMKNIEKYIKQTQMESTNSAPVYMSGPESGIVENNLYI